jgi:hypothetical protein
MTDILPAIDLRHTALLVMDFQAGALGAISQAEALLARVADAIAVVRDRGGHIGYVRVGFEDAEYDAVPAHSMMAPFVAAGRRAHSESPATAVHERNSDLQPMRSTSTGRPARFSSRHRAGALSALVLVCTGCASTTSSPGQSAEDSGMLKVSARYAGGPQGTRTQSVVKAEVKVTAKDTSVNATTDSAGVATFRLPGGRYSVSVPTCGSTGKVEATVTPARSASLTWVCPIP